MEADRAHIEVGVWVFLATKFFGHGEAVKACLVGKGAGLSKEVFPLVCGKAKV